MIPASLQGTICSLVNNAVLGNEDAIAGLRLYLWGRSDEVSNYTANKIKEAEKRAGKTIRDPYIGAFVKQFRKSSEESIAISAEVERLAFVVVKQREQFRKTGRSADYRTSEQAELDLIRLGGRSKEVDAALEREWAKRRRQ